MTATATPETVPVCGAVLGTAISGTRQLEMTCGLPKDHAGLHEPAAPPAPPARKPHTPPAETIAPEEVKP
jgi:hypothetical protein